MSDSTSTGRVPDVTAGMNAPTSGGHARYTAQMVTLVTPETKAHVLRLADARKVGYGEIVREALDRTLPGIAEDEARLNEGRTGWYPWDEENGDAVTAQLTIMGTPAQDELAKRIAAARRINNKRERIRMRMAREPMEVQPRRSVTRADVIRRALDLVLSDMEREQLVRERDTRRAELERAKLAARLPVNDSTDGTG